MSGFGGFGAGLGTFGVNSPNPASVPLVPAVSYEVSSERRSTAIIGELNIRYCIQNSRGPAREAQLVERLPSKVRDLGLIPGRGHYPAVGWRDIMFEYNCRFGMLARGVQFLEAYTCPALYFYL